MICSVKFLFLFLFITTTAVAFVPSIAPSQTGRTRTTDLALQRRDVLITGVLGLIGVPGFANAKSSTFFYDDKIEEKPVEPSQMPTDGKLDLNSAFVGDYKLLQGMYPHAAGKIASNGPYTSVNDIYKIKGITKNDIALFKKYEKLFTVNPPGRGFNERINARVST